MLELGRRGSPGGRLKKQFPGVKVIATEGLQCPTLLMNGFGDHRIEDIGDKHVPCVHNVRNTDAVAAIDEEDCMRILRLFKEPEGKKFLASASVAQPTIDKLGLLGISGICNMLAAVKAAKYQDLDENDVVFTIFTDSAEMYLSRLEEQTTEHGAFTAVDAARTHTGGLERQAVDHFKELTYVDRKAIHNPKYYSWVEQQGKTYEDICAQWDPEYWRELFEEEVVHFERLIENFNREVERV